MAVCSFDGNSDMYGLGIRLGFYLQWFGVILANWLARSEVPGLRFANSVFVAATFLALIIQMAKNVQNLEVVEVYIILLLMFGAYFALIPIYIWRLFTKCNPYWDPSRYPIVNPGALYSNLNLLLLVAVLSFQLWFWFARVPVLSGEDCEQYGFLFAKIRLENTGFVVISVLLYSILTIICLVIVLIKFGCIIVEEDGGENRRHERRKDRAARIRTLQNLDSASRLIVAAVITVATELTIAWNHIRNVNSLSSAGQTIPFLIGLAAVIRILYVWVFKDEDEGRYPHEVPPDQLPPILSWSRPIPVHQMNPEAEYPPPPPHPLPVAQLPPMVGRRARSRRS